MNVRRRYAQLSCEIDIEYPDGPSQPNGRATDADLAGMKTVTVDTGEEEVHVGGRGAVAEDIELRRLAVALPLEDFVDLLYEAGP